MAKKEIPDPKRMANGKDHRPSLSHAKNHISSSQEILEQNSEKKILQGRLMVVTSTPLPWTGVVLRSVGGG